MTRILLTLLTLACFAGCTTMQPLADAQPATIQRAVHPGMIAAIERMNGARLELVVESVGADTLVGVAGGSRYEIPLTDIRAISTRDVSQGPSPLLLTVVTVALVVYAIDNCCEIDLGGRK